MNSRQAAQYQRGLELAKRDALTVVVHGTRKSDGAAVYCVPSRSQANTWHVVVVSGLDLQCDCQAAKHGRYCAHRAAVRARILLEGQLRREAHEREVERAFYRRGAGTHRQAGRARPQAPHRYARIQHLPMSEEEARALAAELERTPGWMAEVFEGATGGRWYLVAAHESDPLTQFVLRSPRDWERLQDVLDEA